MTTQYLKLSDSQVEKAQRMLSGIKGGAEKAMARAINRAVENAKSNVVSSVRENYTAKAGDIRKTIKISKANPKKLQAAVTSVSQLVELSSFKVSPKTVNGKRRSPIRAAVKKGSPKPLGQAFIARVNGKNRVFERVGAKRLPVRQLYGPSIPQMIGNPSVLNKIMEQAQQTLEKRLDHEISAMLSGVTQ